MICLITKCVFFKQIKQANLHLLKKKADVCYFSKSKVCILKTLTICISKANSFFIKQTILLKMFVIV